ncbi:helix-turn-helix transcriptional regulator [Effusibacillus lacus]|uniref:Transcriptional regulator n=1 Tax=Effusibacillus lacus TaxID=1348429 RepID=A0A292YIQ1_9BACL|nr:helix-turn-helix transcriptional regulator [Effusibacillus lacus]TCS74309.1 putative transcriptional regulator [Effusibacillus lacus]GAX88769.1 transcriptional regulator [Effusibacillus lacus]
MRNIVRKLRRDMNLSQQELADAVGVSRQTIIEIEKEKSDPSGSLMLKISNFFGKDPREIFFTDDVNFVQQKGTD